MVGDGGSGASQHSLAPANDGAKGNWLRGLFLAFAPFYFDEIRVFIAGIRLNTTAWNNGIGRWFYFIGLRTRVMMNRDSRGHLYLKVRGEILGFFKDKLVRRHLPRMFPLIKDES